MKKQFYKLCAVPVIALFLCGFGFENSMAILKAQTQERYTIRSDATMVTSDVTVVGPDVADLDENDFVVYDNNVLHPVTYFSRNELPLAIGLLIDTSLTVQPYLPLIQLAAGAALRKLNPEDMVVLYSFDNFPDRHTKLIYDRVEIARKISKLNFELGTNIYETISDAAKYLQKNAPHHRRAIIMISDNYHITVSGNYQYGVSPMIPVNQRDESEKAEKAGEKALEGAVTIFSIRTPSTGIDATGSLPRVRRIVSDTGGAILDISRWTSLQSAVEEVLTKLRRQYTIGFHPSKLGEDGSFHELEIKFADANQCADCILLARKGYYVGIASPLPREQNDSKKQKTKYSPEETDRLLIQQSIATAGTYTYTTGAFGNSVEDVVTNMRKSELSDISFRVDTSRARDSKGNTMLRIDLGIFPDRIKFLKSQNRYACKLHIGIFYFNQYMRTIGSDVQILEGQLEEDTYRKAFGYGIPFSAEVPLKVDKQYVSVVVYDENSDRAGSRLILPLPVE
jgi:Ca-activated chloride channel family protein